MNSWLRGVYGFSCAARGMGRVEYQYSRQGGRAEKIVCDKGKMLYSYVLYLCDQVRRYIGCSRGHTCVFILKHKITGYTVNTPFATHVSVAICPNNRSCSLYQHISYVLPLRPLQRFITIHIKV